ncbi:BnaCnng27450D [Brassica napus]|uniref:BnaCnng27450D protein n=1 Tax=Brassica napus TaxID=3708 RepID=A0A078IX04_BRANA|nr:BnaCnng27450D [Brassica napus]
MVAGARVCGVPDGIRSTVIHLPSHLSVAAVLKEKCKIDLCVMRITGSSKMETTYQDGVNLCKKRESQLMVIHQAVTTTGCCCCEKFMWSLRPRTYQNLKIRDL